MEQVNQNTPVPQVASEANSSMASSQSGSRFQGFKNFVKEKKKLVIGIAVGLAIIIGIIIFLAVRNGGQITPQNMGTNKPESSFSQVTREERVNIAAQEVVFIKSQERPDGYYNYVYDYDAQCTQVNGVKTCPFNGTDMFETTNAWAALSHFAAYEISGNKEYLNKSVEDIRKLDEYCTKDRTQCLWVLVQPSLIYNKTQNPVMLSFLRAQAPALKTAPLSDDLMLASIQVRAMFMMGNILNDSALITRAQTDLEKLSERLSSQPSMYPDTEKRFAQNSCWVTLANLYSSSVNAESTREFLNQGNIVRNFKYYNNPIEIQPCIEAYSILAGLTSQESDKSTVIELQKLANDAFLDGRGGAKKVYGNGGYLFYKLGFDTKTPGFMVLTDSAYASYLQSLILQ